MYLSATVNQQWVVKRLLRQVMPAIAGVLLSLFSNLAVAEVRFDISAAQVNLVDKVYYLNARIDYKLSDKVLEVMHKGVPVVVVLDIEFLRSRKYLWNETVAQLAQRYRLEYHALTQQYLVTNLNSGSQHSFPTLEVALTQLGTVVDLPILDQQLMARKGRYIGLMQASIDVAALPTPLRLRAYFSSDWQLASEWYSWILPN
ncbi:hypothetical protein MNBD_GAMMA17-1339 [hydrothermal vent metagenome]|uniref:Proline rich signal peptide protein n=1 Tax=hydrothermal vent metagenome TaxID=652676 RepID=A0A3B0ZKH3_9ZZZZ